ncbi:Rieske (2Fe-2S) domain-containing protein, partial [Pseudomonas sp. CF161]
MNSHPGWWPVALSRQLQRQPLACTLHGVPLVLFRDAAGAPAVLPDR